MKKSRILFCIFSVVLALFSFTSSVHAAGTTYTVCTSGCDFTSLYDASIAPGIGGADIIQLTAGYVFNDANEGTSIVLPVSVTLECLPGSDTVGDQASARIQLNPSGDDTIQNCTFENVFFDASNTGNVKWLGNTISAAAESQIVLTNDDGIEISNNIGVQNIRLQTADNVVINNNTITCRFDQSCISASIAGGGSDYTDSASISSNVDITNNHISNYSPNSAGDYISIYAGENINITNNTIDAAIVQNDTYTVMTSFSNSEVYIAYNYYILPEKTVGASSNSWGVNLRVGDGDMTITAEHNTIIMRDGTNASMLSGSTCFGLYDDGSHGNPSVTLQVNYNLCYSPSTAPGGSGYGIALTYVPGNVTLSIPNSYNGISHVAASISDLNNVFTSLDATTTTADPMLRTQNVSTADDYNPAPMSRYFDVNGAQDIGVLSAARVTHYSIDDSCTIDYATCYFSGNNVSTFLSSILKDGDIVDIAAGTYAPMLLTGSFNNVTIQGAGVGTVFDAGGNSNAVYLPNFTNSTVKNLKTTGSTSPTSTTYAIDYSEMSDGVNLYDDGAAVSGGSDIMLIASGTPSPGSCPFDATTDNNHDITALVGTPQNWNLYLVNYLGLRLTAFAQDNYLSGASAFLQCANPGEVTVEHYIPNIFTVTNGVFTYNAAAAAAEGISVKPGDTSPPAIHRTVITDNYGGIVLHNSTDNIVEAVTSTNNDNAVVLTGTSASNVIKNSTLQNSAAKDVIMLTTANNALQDSVFSISALDVQNTGNLDIYYTVKTTVQEGSSPINGAVTTIRNALQQLVGTVTTGISGVSALSTPILATSISNGGSLSITSGGRNPFSFSTSNAGYVSQTTSNFISTPEQNISVSLNPVSTSVGGGIYVPQNVTPGISVTKSATPSNSLSVPGSVSYIYIVKNISTVPVGTIAVTDSVCSPVFRIAGDINSNNILDASETWEFSCSTYVTQTTKSNVVATGVAGGSSIQASADFTLTVGATPQQPVISVVKNRSPAVLPAAGGVVNYTYTVTNPGEVPLSHVLVTDSGCAPLSSPSGDINNNGLLDISETWKYTCHIRLTQTTLTIVTAQGSANGIIVKDYTSGTTVVGQVEGVVDTSAEDGIAYYIVQPFDSLKTIALKLYGDREQWKRLVELNKIAFPSLVSNPEVVVAGWRIRYEVPRLYDYQFITQSPYPAVMKPGQVSNVWVEIKNTGKTPWFNVGKHPVRLGTGSAFGATNQQRDYASEFAHASWLSNNRPVTIMHPIIEPGWHTRFQFSIKAPDKPGTYKAYFTPVVDGVDWMKDIGLYWEIQVKS